MAVAGYWYTIVYIALFLVGAAVGFLVDKAGTKTKSALLTGATLGAGGLYLMDAIIRLFSSVSQEWEWLYWITFISAALILLAAAVFVLLL